MGESEVQCLGQTIEVDSSRMDYIWVQYMQLHPSFHAFYASYFFTFHVMCVSLIFLCVLKFIQQTKTQIPAILNADITSINLSNPPTPLIYGSHSSPLGIITFNIKIDTNQSSERSPAHSIFHSKAILISFMFFSPLVLPQKENPNDYSQITFEDISIQHEIQQKIKRISNFC